jgi:hypothetical protein
MVFFDKNGTYRRGDEPEGRWEYNRSNDQLVLKWFKYKQNVLTKTDGCFSGNGLTLSRPPVLL